MDEPEGSLSPVQGDITVGLTNQTGFIWCDEVRLSYLYVCVCEVDEVARYMSQSLMSVHRGGLTCPVKCWPTCLSRLSSNETRTTVSRRREQSQMAPSEEGR